MPNLIEVQRESYTSSSCAQPATGYVSGLEKTLRSVFPIRDFAGTAELDFVHYELEDPKYDTNECRQRGITYAAPMKVTLRLIVFEVDAETETRSVLDIKEQDVYMGDMPLMTDNGTFIINGTERVIVSQMHRSPGVLFDHDRGKTHSSGKYPVCRARHSLSRFVARFRIRRQGHRQRPHRPQAQAAGHRAALCAGPDRRGDPRPLLRQGHLGARPKAAGTCPLWSNSGAAPKPAFDIVDAKSGEVVFPPGTKISPRAANKAAKDGLEQAADPDRGNLRPLCRAAT